MAPEVSPAPVDALVALGLTPAEAEVYVDLLARPEPVTAYRVGKDLGRATANVYKTIDALAERGAVLLGEGEPRTCRAVAPGELLGAMDRSWSARSGQAAHALANVLPPDPDERVYDIRSADLVLERIGRMLAAAESVAVLDLAPAPFAALHPEICAAAARGIRTFVLVHEPVHDPIPGADVVVAAEAETEARRGRWPSHPIKCVVDARESLVARLAFAGDAVHEATWTRRLHLCCVLHASFLREHAFHRAARMARAPGAPAPLRDAIDDAAMFDPADVPGQRELRRADGMRPA
ncbi:MAG: TrmB family transcriptional regulator [Phycisphaerales bacterium]